MISLNFIVFELTHNVIFEVELFLRQLHLCVLLLHVYQLMQSFLKEIQRFIIIYQISTIFISSTPNYLSF